jgi:DNA-binding MarR family transcriptional regulator
MTFDRYNSPGYVVNYLARIFAQALERRIRAHGVSVGQFPVLLCLWEEDGLTQTQLAERLAIEQPTVANTLKRMERDGLIHRVADAQDRRQSHIHLTPRGRALEEPLTREANGVNAIATGGLGGEDKARLMTLLHRLVANLEQDARAPRS